MTSIYLILLPQVFSIFSVFANVKAGIAEMPSSLKAGNAQVGKTVCPANAS